MGNQTDTKQRGDAGWGCLRARVGKQLRRLTSNTVALCLRGKYLCKAKREGDRVGRVHAPRQKPTTTSRRCVRRIHAQMTRHSPSAKVERYL